MSAENYKYTMCFILLHFKFIWKNILLHLLIQTYWTRHIEHFERYIIRFVVPLVESLPRNFFYSCNLRSQPFWGHTVPTKTKHKFSNSWNFEYNFRCSSCSCLADKASYGCRSGMWRTLTSWRRKSLGNWSQQFWLASQRCALSLSGRMSKLFTRGT